MNQAQPRAQLWDQQRAAAETGSAVGSVWTIDEVYVSCGVTYVVLVEWEDDQGDGFEVSAFCPLDDGQLEVLRAIVRDVRAPEPVT